MDKVLTHVRLLVDNYKDCFNFYKDLLGLKVAWGNPDTRYAEFEAGGARLAIFEKSEMAKVVGTSERPTASDCQDEVVVILRVEDVDAVCSDLASRGVELVTPVQDRVDWGIRTGHLRDPDGNLIEINRPLR
jgi:catechol 2,3-dioxygenase-like lactoylglutathione lyase family enzyme